MKERFLHRLDPRTKVFSLLAVSLFIVTSESWVRLAWGSVAILGAFAASGLGVAEMLRRLRFVAWFVAVIVALNAAFAGGYVVVQLGGVSVTREGIEAGAFLSSKIVLLLWASFLFIRSTTIPDMLDGLGSGLRFLRIPAGPPLVSASVVLNFVPVLVRTAQRIKRAQLARGAGEEAGFFAQVRNTAALSLPLFAAVFRSADNLADAIDARCYSPSHQRTQLHGLRWGRADQCVAAGIVALTLLGRVIV